MSTRDGICQCDEAQSGLPGNRSVRSTVSLVSSVGNLHFRHERESARIISLEAASSLVIAGDRLRSRREVWRGYAKQYLGHMRAESAPDPDFYGGRRWRRDCDVVNCDHVASDF